MKHIDLDIDLIETMSDVYSVCSQLNCILKLKKHISLEFPVSKYGININGVDMYGSVLIFGGDFGSNHLIVKEKIDG